MNYYAFHIGDCLRDTAHLSLLEHGCYRRLLDVYYSLETGIPCDQAYRKVGARSQEERDAVDAVLSEFFELRDGVWRQSRADREIETFQHARQQGARGGRPPKASNAIGSTTAKNENPPVSETAALENPPVSKIPTFENPPVSKTPVFENPPPNPPLTNNHLPDISPPPNGGSPVAAEKPPGLEPPGWLEGDSGELMYGDPDLALAQALGWWAFRLKNKRGKRVFEPAAIHFEKLLSVAKWLSDFVPDEDALECELQSLTDWAAGSVSVKWKHPDAVLRQCLGRVEPRWRQVARERQRDKAASKAASSLAKSSRVDIASMLGVAEGAV